MVIDTERHGRVTSVTVTWVPDQDTIGFKGYGSSLRSKGDVELAEIGETIALGRAIQDLGRQVEASGHSQCVSKSEYARVMHLIVRRVNARQPSARVAAQTRSNLAIAAARTHARVLDLAAADSPVRKAMADQIFGNLILGTEALSAEAPEPSWGRT
jgi:hypothetical protein